MQEIWYYIVEEFKALGLRCVAFGPEFWLLGPSLILLLVVCILLIIDIRR